MHIRVENQHTGEAFELCYDRDTQTCRVLGFGDFGQLLALEQIASSLGVTVMQIVSTPEHIKKLKEVGWKESNLSVLEKEVT